MTFNPYDGRNRYRDEKMLLVMDTSGGDQAIWSFRGVMEFTPEDALDILKKMDWAGATARMINDFECALFHTSMRFFETGPVWDNLPEDAEDAISDGPRLVWLTEIEGFTWDDAARTEIERLRVDDEQIMFTFYVRHGGNTEYCTPAVSRDDLVGYLQQCRLPD